MTYISLNKKNICHFVVRLGEIFGLAQCDGYTGNFDINIRPDNGVPVKDEIEERDRRHI